MNGVLVALTTILAWLLLLAAAAAVGSYWFLALWALLARRPRPRDEGAPRNRFLILIPAHNEEAGLASTLEACSRLDYPGELYSVVVIADNCSDRTADVARAHGRRCLERHAPGELGKGYALQHAIEQLPAADDAVVVLDADCLIDHDALRAFDRRLRSGQRVLQARYVVANPDESPISYALAVGNHLENDFFYAPREQLGGTVLLRGTGMVLHRDVLARFPWRAHSIVEDVEYGVALARAGVRVRFAAETAVRSRFPATDDQLRVQRERWAGGHFALARRQGWSLLWRGLLRGRRSALDCGWTLLTLSRPLVIVLALLDVAVHAVRMLLLPGAFAAQGLACALLLLVLLLAYFGLGVVALGLSARRLRLLMRAPVVALRLAIIGLRGTWGAGRADWVRTPR